MTQGQIVTFVIIARCCFAKYAVKVGALGIIGDPSFAEHKLQLLLVRSYLKTIKCYDPETEDNCLTLVQITAMMNQVMKILGQCGDPLGLAESNADCCDPLHGVTIVNA